MRKERALFKSSTAGEEAEPPAFCRICAFRSPSQERRRGVRREAMHMEAFRSLSTSRTATRAARGVRKVCQQRIQIKILTLSAANSSSSALGRLASNASATTAVGVGHHIEALDVVA